MALLGEIKSILINFNITPKNKDGDIIINIDDAKIKGVERVDNYKLKLILEDDEGNKGFSYITTDPADSIQGRNILNEIQLCTKIKGVPLSVLPKLDLNFLK